MQEGLELHCLDALKPHESHTKVVCDKFNEYINPSLSEVKIIFSLYNCDSLVIITEGGRIAVVVASKQLIRVDIAEAWTNIITIYSNELLLNWLPIFETNSSPLQQISINLLLQMRNAFILDQLCCYQDSQTLYPGGTAITEKILGLITEQQIQPSLKSLNNTSQQMTKHFNTTKYAPPMARDPNFISFLKALRYGMGPQALTPVLGYSTIARIAKVSVTHVRKLLLQQAASQFSIAVQPNTPVKKFSQEQISFLVSPRTLAQWAPYTLSQRATFFHRRFPEIKISATSIRRIYHAHGIKYKAIRRGKKLVDTSQEPYKQLYSNLINKVRTSLACGTSIVFADEAVFTYNTFQSKAWAAKGDNITFEDKMTSIKTQAVVAGYSQQRGLEALLICPSAVSTSQFITFLERLSDLHHNNRFALFLDNLSVHKSRLAMRAYERLNIEPIFNLPYSPQYNGIESVFSIAKQYYKKLLLEVLVNKKTVNPRQLIRTAFEMISFDHSTNCLRHGLNELLK